VTTTIKTDFKIETDTGFLNDSTRTLFQIKKELKRMVFIINRTEGKVKITGPEYENEVHYDNEIMSMDRARNIWTLLIEEGWTRSK
jgi:site-specific DNA-adenine methylase